MKGIVALATVLVIGLASVQAAQTDDQQKKDKKKTQATQTTSGRASSGGQASNRHVTTQTRSRQISSQTGNQRINSQASTRHVSSQTSSNQQATNRYSKKASSNVKTSGTQERAQIVRTNKVNKTKNQANIVANNNVRTKNITFSHFRRTGNELSFNVARQRFVRVQHDRSWWRSHYSRIVFYGGGYWYWNAGWWYPAWGYSPYYNNYVYDGPIFGYGYAAPGDVTVEVQRALAQQGYYYGPIDGILGPATRGAIQRYQIDHGLAVTAAIDEQTLYTLGLA